MQDPELFTSNNSDIDAITIEPTFDDVIEEHFEAGVSQALGEEVTPEPASQPTLFAGLTEDDFKAIIAKANKVDDIEQKYQSLHDKAFGTIGQLKQEIAQIKQQATVVREAVPISKEAFKELTDYFGDESLSTALVNGLNSIQLGGGESRSPVVDEAAILARVDERLTERERELEKRELNRVHPDWQVVSSSPEFVEWRGTLREDDQALLMNTWDAGVLSQAFTRFKDYQAKKQEKLHSRQQRLEDAIAPTGGRSRAANSADDYFNQGVKKVLEANKR